MAFAKRLTVEGGVTTIPVSGFYVGPQPPTHLVRFCYCKEDSKLQAAVERLKDYLKVAEGDSKGGHLPKASR